MKKSLFVLFIILLIAVVFVLGAKLFDDSSAEQFCATNATRFLEQLKERLADAIYLDVGTDIQSIVDNAAPNSIFLIGEGIHRLQSIRPRDNDIFIGEEGTVLNGAIVLEDFIAEGGHWLAFHPQLQNLEPRAGGTCRLGHERCNHPYSLYIDDQPIPQVTSVDLLVPNTWFFDYDTDKILLGLNPEGHRIELSSIFHAFQGSAKDVVIYNLTIEKYAGFGQMGAIRAQDASNWLIMHNEVRLNSAVGITFGTDMQIVQNRLIQNGQMGLSGQGDNVLICANEIAHNNYSQYEPAWEAGGVKIVASTNVQVLSNYVHNNDGAGLWTDIGSNKIVYADNLILANTGSGILHEISYEASIHNNIVRFNINQMSSVYLGAQIALSSSGNTEVYENDVVAGHEGGNGIVIIQQARGEGRLGRYEARNNHVHDNRIVILNHVGETAAATDMANVPWFWQENYFTGNQYYGSEVGLALWGWDNRKMNWQDFRQLHNREGSYNLTIPVDALTSPAWQDFFWNEPQN